MSSSHELPAAAMATAETAGPEPEQEHPWEISLRKYLLLLATLVATVTYGVGFSPPGGVWEDADADGGHVAGEPIMRARGHTRYMVFFCCNAAAFASSLVVTVLILLFAVVHEKKGVWITVMPLRVVMVMDLVSLMAAYAAGTCTDTFTTIYSSLLVSVVFVYVLVQMVLASSPDTVKVLASCYSGGGELIVDDRPRQILTLIAPDDPIDDRLRKVLMLLATFAVSVTYVAGLSTPGGFWVDDDDDGHHAGNAILKDLSDARLTAFFVCNTTAFVASLLIVVLLLDGKLRAQRTVRSTNLYGCIIVALAGLIGAYAAGGCREADTTAYVLALVGAVLAYIVLFHVTLVKLAARLKLQTSNIIATTISTNHVGRKEEQLSQARSLVLLLATLAATITYQAGLDPPGGLWQLDDGGGEGRHRAGDPILLTAKARRYGVFFYCNSVAFVASLVTIVLVQIEGTLKHHALEAAMVLDLFGLIGAYAAGSCRDVSTSVYVMALAGAVLVYVVIHVVFFTLDEGEMDGEEHALMEKRRKRLLLFAILSATVTYQAGLTPPGGFVVSGEHAGDSVLLANSPVRYHAFFYCNSVSFMMSAALIVLLVNPNLYRPAIRSYALSVCTAAGPFSLIGAYAAGSAAQYVDTLIYFFVLVALIIILVLVLLLVFLVKPNKNDKRTPPPPSPADTAAARNNDGQLSSITDADELELSVSKKMHAKRKYLMLLGILVASVTYQAGLKPPGGFWQSDGGAGNPVMHDNRRPRYLVFFYSNSTSFEASIVVIVLLLLPAKSALQRNKWWLRVMNLTVVLDLLTLMVAYAAGSGREWRTSVYVVALVPAVLAYVAVHVMLSFLHRRARRRGQGGVHGELMPIEQPGQLQGQGEHQHQQGDDHV